MTHLKLIQALGSLCVFLFSCGVFAQRTYIHCGALIDGIHNEIQRGMTIVVEGNTIVKIEKGYLVAGASDKEIDLKTKFVLPGLIDTHVHLTFQASRNRPMEKFTLSEADIAFRSLQYAETTLMAGFTTVRDLGGYSGVNIALRNAVNAGLVKGPRIFTSGGGLSATGGHGDPTNGLRREMMGDPGVELGIINGRDACLKAVRQQVKYGSDLIKVMATGGTLSPEKDGTGPHLMEEELKAIVEAARDLGLQVAAHAHGAEGIKRAVRAGVASIEHGTFIDEEGLSLMKQHGTFYVGTVVAGKSVTDSAKVPGYFSDVVREKASRSGPKAQDAFAHAYKAGVKIAFGTDAGIFVHGKNALEFQYMTEAGMPPMDAIKSATIRAAELIGVKEKIGSIEIGKYADVVAVGENPLEKINTLMHILFVMKDGVIYKNLP